MAKISNKTATIQRGLLLYVTCRGSVYTWLRHTIVPQLAQTSSEPWQGIVSTTPAQAPHMRFQPSSTGSPHTITSGHRTKSVIIGGEQPHPHRDLTE